MREENNMKIFDGIKLLLVILFCVWCVTLVAGCEADYQYQPHHVDVIYDDSRTQHALGMEYKTLRQCLYMIEDRPEFRCHRS